MRVTYTTLAICIALTACAPSRDVSTVGQPSLTAAITVPPTSGFGDPSTAMTIDAQGNVNWVSGAWRVPLPVSAGDAIGTVTVIVRDNGPGNGTSSLDYNNVLVNLISRTSMGDTSRGFIASNASGTRQMLTFTPTGGQYVVQAGDEMLVAFSGLKGGALPGPSTVSSMTGVIMIGPPPAPAPPQHVRRFSPPWLQQGPFVISLNPLPGTNPPVWRSTGTIPAIASFEIPFQAGETIIGLGWDTYGDTRLGGLGSIDVLYQSTVGGIASGGSLSQPASTFDTGSSSGWRHTTVAPFVPQSLEVNGMLWVELEVDQDNYYIGAITATFQ